MSQHALGALSLLLMHKMSCPHDSLCPTGSHSHTEIADRLFSLMKRLFESDSRTRVQGIGSFEKLAQKIQEEFQKCPESFLMDYNWANWNLEEWLSKMTPVNGALFEGDLARFSFDNVFR